MLTDKKEAPLAEHHHASHSRHLLKHLRRSMKRESGDRERHSETKPLRPALLAAIILLVVLLVGVHVVGGMLLLRSGLGSLSLENPIAYGLLGLVLVTVVFKLRHMAVRTSRPK